MTLDSGAAEDVEAGICGLYKSVVGKNRESTWLEWMGMKNKEKEEINTLLQKHASNWAEREEIDLSQMHMARPRGASSRRIKIGFVHEVFKMPSSKRSEKKKINKNLAFVMEGPALVHVFGKPILEKMLFEVTNSCTAVIACRVSPKQKAQLVRLVKERVKPAPVTLAIGDGANDVGMIQEAHVGIGISGNEGQQAVNASDFAIAQFRYLKRLLLVHGRWDYKRISLVVLYSFYKNLVLVMTLFFYSMYTGYSGTSLYEDNILAGYNFFLGLPILVLGLLDKDVSANYAMNHPEMYISGRRNMDLDVIQVLRWICAAFLHGYFAYFLVVELLTEGSVISESSYYALGLSVYSVLILTMDYKCLLSYKTINGCPRCVHPRGPSNGE